MHIRTHMAPPLPPHLRPQAGLGDLGDGLSVDARESFDVFDSEPTGDEDEAGSDAAPGVPPAVEEEGEKKGKKKARKSLDIPAPVLGPGGEKLKLATDFTPPGAWRNLSTTKNSFVLGGRTEAWSVLGSKQLSNLPHVTQIAAHTCTHIHTHRGSRGSLSRVPGRVRKPRGARGGRYGGVALTGSCVMMCCALFFVSLLSCIVGMFLGSCGGLLLFLLAFFCYLLVYFIGLFLCFLLVCCTLYCICCRFWFSCPHGLIYFVDFPFVRCISRSSLPL